MRCFIAVALCVIPAVSRADDAYEKAVPSVVSVFCTTTDGGSSMGTGVVTADGIITATHVIKSAKVVLVFFPMRDDTGAVIGEAWKYDVPKHAKQCTVVGTDSQRGLALLRLKEPKKCQPVELASVVASPGDPVFTIAAACGKSMWHPMAGHVRDAWSRDSLPPNVDGFKGGMVQASIRIRPDDGGVPIFDRAGKLVGINLIAMKKDQEQSAIDASEVRAFLAEMQARGPGGGMN